MIVLARDVTVEIDRPIRERQTVMYFSTMRDGIAAHEANGGTFFAPETLRFWSSRIGSRIYGGQYFVTSEDNYNRTRRLYSVRKFTGPDGRVDTVDFQTYASRSGAVAAAKRYANKPAEVAA